MEKNMSLEEQLVRQKFALVLTKVCIEGITEFDPKCLMRAFKYALGISKGVTETLSFDQIKILMELDIIFKDGIFYKAEALNYPKFNVEE